MNRRIGDLRFAWRLVVVLCAVATGCVCHGQTTTQLHLINPKTPAELQELIRFRGSPLSIVSAHRGGARVGFPENAIETFEHTLRHVPSMLEIDPRMTKDGKLVIHHDATLDRTTTGTGQVAEHTLAELKTLFLRDINGNVTDYRIPTLDEAMTWAKGKTILVLDQKDVPLEVRVQKIAEHQAQSYAILIVGSVSDARKCYELDKSICMEVMMGDRGKFQAFEKSGVPWSNIIAFVGHTPPQDHELLEMIHAKGARCMAGTSRYLDKELVIGALEQPSDLKVRYQELLTNGVDIIETDRPLEVGAMLFETTLTAVKSAEMETVQLNPDASGFSLHPSGKRFVPWGHNYASVDILERLANDPARVEREFAEMRAAGTTVARIHPEMPRLLSGPEKADPAALDQMRRLLEIAEQSGIRLMITGLACYKIADRMPWYDAMDEQDRWKTQAFFWKTISETCAQSPVVFAYDLINEPAAVGKQADGWYTGRMGEVEFCQRLSLDAGERSGDDIFRQWTERMVAAIRSHDQTRLITIGMLPFPGAYKVAAEQLDFVSPHLYPKTGKVDEEISLLKRFDWGKPIVIGETFPLSCGADDERDFLLKSRETADGWIGHWPDESPSELAKLEELGEATIHNAIWLSWVRLFQDVGPQMTGEASTDRP
jgi:glycerophosphoryl diester phosphodiesterase